MADTQVLKNCLHRPFVLVMELLGLLLYGVYFSNVVLLLPPAAEDSNFLHGERFWFLMVAYEPETVRSHA